MKRLFLLVLLPLGLSAEPTTVPSKITSVTVYQSGATVFRTAQVTLEAGRQSILFSNLPEGLNENQIQVSFPLDWQIIDQKYKQETSPESIPKIRLLQEKLLSKESEITSIEDKLRVLQSQEDLLRSNSEINKYGNYTPQQFKDLYAFYSAKQEEIVVQKRKQIQLRKHALNELQELRRDLTLLRVAQFDSKPSYEVQLVVKKSGTFTIGLNYYVEKAGWASRYNLRLMQLDQPLQLEHFALVAQQTGEDWENANLTISTGNPQYGSSLPQIVPWRINMNNNLYPHLQQTPRTNSFGNMGTGSITGLVTHGQTGESVQNATVEVYVNNQMLYVTFTNEEGTFSIDNIANGTYNIKILSYGFNEIQTTKVITSSSPAFLNLKMYPTSGESDIVNMAVREITSVSAATAGVFQSDEGQATSLDYHLSRKQSLAKNKPSIQTNLYQQEKISSTSYTLKEKYTLPSDGNPRTLLVRTISLPAELQYQAVPALQEGVYLYANILDWRGLNLETGSLRIYTEGQYQGEFDFNPADYQDTLQLSLGRDNGVKVNRVVVHQKTTKNFFGSKVTRGFSYNYEIVNDKSKTIRLVIKDQVPLAEHSDIEVDNIKTGTGKRNQTTGVVSWEYTLEPGGKASDPLEFEVTYPKGWSPNLPR